MLPPSAPGYFGGSSTPPPSTQNPYDSDPGYASALAQQQLGISQAEQALNNLIAQRIVAYGDPTLAKMAGFNLDPQAEGMARQNYLAGNSELSRLDHSHQLAAQAIINRLAGHGILFSGETGYQQGEEGRAYGNNVYDAQQRALADILGYRQNTLQQENALRGNTQSALENAYTNYVNNPQLYGNGATTPPALAKSPLKPPALPKPASSVSRVINTLGGVKSPTPRVLPNAYNTGQKRYG